MINRDIFNPFMVVCSVPMPHLTSPSLERRAEEGRKSRKSENKALSP
jgi:hypothetical protein